jgi:hypothetical protein
LRTAVTTIGQSNNDTSGKSLNDNDAAQFMDESGQSIGFGGQFNVDLDPRLLFGGDNTDNIMDYPTIDWNNGAFANGNNLALLLDGGEESDRNELSPHDQLARENERIALEEADFHDLFLPGGDSLLPYDPYTAQDLFDPFDITALDPFDITAL